MEILKKQPNISSDFCSCFLFLDLCCCVSLFSFTKWQKPATDVFIVLLASCQWSILLSCCEMKLLHAQLSPRFAMIKRWRKRANCECVGKHFSLSLNVCLRSKSWTAPDTKNSQTAFYQALKSLVDGMGHSWSYTVFYRECGSNLSWDAAVALLLELEQLAFFCMWFMEESTGPDLRLKEMLVIIWSAVAHLLLISDNEIPERISGMLEYSILLKIAAEWLIPDKLDPSPNNEMFVSHLILVPKTWNGMMIELLIKCHDACQST